MVICGEVISSTKFDGSESVVTNPPDSSNSGTLFRLRVLASSDKRMAESYVARRKSSVGVTWSVAVAVGELPEPIVGVIWSVASVVGESAAPIVAESSIEHPVIRRVTRSA
jgi:hypothetical protein